MSSAQAKKTIRPSDSETLYLLTRGPKSPLRLFFSRTGVVILLLLVQVLLLLFFFLKLAKWLPLLFGSSSVIAFLIVLWLMGTRDNPQIKISWIVLILLVPVFGSLFYLFSNWQFNNRHIHDLFQKRGNEITPLLQQQIDLAATADLDKDLLNTATYLRKNGDYGLYAAEEVKYYPSGEDFLPDLLEALRKAEKFIFMEYFIISEGVMWGQILSILAAKAAAGVDVRVLYDGTCSFTVLPPTYPQMLAKLGIKCKIFARLRPFFSTHYNNRDHRKICAIDGHIGFTGGVNLADEYINAISPYGYWKDSAIQVRGGAAESLTRQFLQVWGVSEVEKEELAPFFQIPSPTDNQLQKQTDAYVIPYADCPLDRENVGESLYIDLLAKATDYAYIRTPYFIPDNELVQAICFAAKRGVRTVMTLPHIPDQWYAQVLARSYYAELIDAGVEVYEFTPGFLHAKEMLVDDRRAIVGTINMDYRSLYLHYENAIYLHNVSAIQDLRADYEDMLGQCQRMPRPQEGWLGLVKSIPSRVLRIVAPLM